jgi:uncharacterized membrane-anchored protein
MRHPNLNRLALAAALALLIVPCAQAQDAKPSAGQSAEQHQAGESQGPASDAWQAVARVMQRGPRSVSLRDQATLKLPEGYGFVPTREASELMEAMGNDVGPDFIGLIMPLAEDQDWIVSVDFDPAGYINDEDARHWKADELLSNLKEGTEAGNARRIKLGIAPLEVTRWIEPPSYDSATQRLVWSAEARDKGAPAGADNTVNYNTYVLGREGYVSLDLITTASAVEAQKPMAKRLLGEVAFVDGKRYADFDASTDKVAAYGLAALVGGVAVKKLGLLAVIGAFLAKSFKLIVVGVVAIGAAIRKFFSRKS